MKKVKSTLIGGDIFMAIDSALDLLQERYKKRKTDRKIFILTNGKGKSEYTNYHMGALA